THHPVPSPCGTYIAALAGPRLQIRDTASLDIIRAVSIRPEPAAKSAPIIRWAPPETTSSKSARSASGARSHRLLHASSDHIRVYDLADRDWSAAINNGSGGMGKIVGAEFGRNGNEVLVWNDFGAKLTVWDLRTGRSVEIRDPKVWGNVRDGGRGWGWRPGSGVGDGGGEGVFALLSRPGPLDVVTLHCKGSYRVLKTVVVATQDALGLRWSADGMWFAVWDAPSAGTRVCVYTADGHLYRTYGGELDDGVRGLGVKSVEWSPRGDFMAVGGFDQRVALLSTRTFAPTVFLDHTSIVQLPEGNIWQESVSATSARSYGIAAQPVNPPTATRSPSEPISKMGISVIAFNADGTLIVTRDDAMPTSVWLWDLTRLTARTVLIQHAPIKSLSWHPSNPHLLLIQCVHEEPIIYLWDATKDEPQIIGVPLEKTAGGLKLDARWLSIKGASDEDGKPGLVCSDAAHGFLTVWPHGKREDDESEEEEEQQQEDDGSVDSRPATPGGSVNDSEDSLYNILTGRTPLPELEDSTTRRFEESEEEEGSERLEDTFRGKHAHLDEPLRDSECF
ncbi:tricorn protease domain 2-containing protein, partial [Saccharata proteae CBS 121410]